jgi:hypothetical protein
MVPTPNVCTSSFIQPHRVPIPTWPTKERDASQRVECQIPRPQTEITVMSAAEVVYWLRRCRYDRSRRVPIARIAAASGLSRMTLYRAMAGDTSEATCAALTPVLTALADGAIAFERRRRVWELVEHYRLRPEPGPLV